MNRTPTPATERAASPPGVERAPKNPPRPPGKRARGPTPTGAVALELARALGAACLLAPRAIGYLAQRRRLEVELRQDLARAAPVAPPPTLGAPPRRPLTIFLACAEASGEMHAENLVPALRRRLAELGAPAPRFVGLGGARLAERGVELLARPVDRAAMGLSGVVSALPYYLGLLTRCAERFRDDPPDLLLPVDSPALHVPLARIARRYGVPVVHFVTPQYWGWAPWRVGGYRRAVDRALTILPFEPSWFARHGVATQHVGHPICDTWDEVAAPEPSDSADSRGTKDLEARALVLLPGSREGVIDRNLPWMLALAAELRLTRELPVRVVHERRELGPALERHVAAAGAGGWATVAVGDLHAELRGARAALAVSGTVLLELLHRRLPSVVIYRLAHRREEWLSRRFLTTPYFSSVNLLAGRETYPEFAFAGDGPRAAVLAALGRSLDDEAWRAACRADLERAAERLGPPGAVERAAEQALALALARVDSRESSKAAPSATSGAAPGATSGAAPGATSGAAAGVTRTAASIEAGAEPTKPPPAVHPPRTDLEDAVGHAS